MLKMIKEFCGFVVAWFLAVVLVAWNGAICSVLWNWFVAPAIGQSSVSIGTGIGFVLIYFLGRMLTVATAPDALFIVNFDEPHHWVPRWVILPAVILALGYLVNSFNLGSVPL